MGRVCTVLLAVLGTFAVSSSGAAQQASLLRMGLGYRLPSAPIAEPEPAEPTFTFEAGYQGEGPSNWLGTSDEVGFGVAHGVQLRLLGAVGRHVQLGGGFRFLRRERETEKQSLFEAGFRGRINASLSEALTFYGQLGIDYTHLRGFVGASEHGLGASTRAGLAFDFGRTFGLYAEVGVGVRYRIGLGYQDPTFLFPEFRSVWEFSGQFGAGTRLRF